MWETVIWGGVYWSAKLSPTHPRGGTYFLRGGCFRNGVTQGYPCFMFEFMCWTSAQVTPEENESRSGSMDSLKNQSGSKINDSPFELRMHHFEGGSRGGGGTLGGGRPAGLAPDLEPTAHPPPRWGFNHSAMDVTRYDQARGDFDAAIDIRPSLCILCHTGEKTRMLTTRKNCHLSSRDIGPHIVYSPNMQQLQPPNPVKIHGGFRSKQPSLIFFTARVCVSLGFSIILWFLSAHIDMCAQMP